MKKGEIYGFEHAAGHSSMIVREVDEEYVHYSKWGGDEGWAKKRFRMPLGAAKKKFWLLFPVDRKKRND